MPAAEVHLFRQLFDAASSSYTYLLADPAGAAVLIDSVYEQHLRDRALIEELGLHLVAVLDTHCHADHVTGAWLMRQATGCRIGVSDGYAPPIEGGDLRLAHGDCVEFGTARLSVRATPGHTAGCLTFVTADAALAFTGDARLIRGTGRCDFQQGDAHRLYRSITEQIFSLPDSCLVCPAHDYAGRTLSSVGEERRHNPRIGGQADERDFVGSVENLHLPHPKQIAVALPANLRSGRPPDGQCPRPADWGPVRRTYAGVLEIEPGWVAEHLAALHILDVRQAEELSGSSRIPGAQSIPLGELTARVAEVPTERPVVAVCHAGMRSAQAVALLRAAGHTRCANLHGGMLLWQELGLPTRPA